MFLGEIFKMPRYEKDDLSLSPDGSVWIAKFPSVKDDWEIGRASCRERVS